MVRAKAGALLRLRPRIDDHALVLYAPGVFAGAAPIC
jgi:hypothetical protein